MENIILSPKEFLYLCWQEGAKEVYGIIDAYKDFNTDDVSGEIRSIQGSLENKGYIESDFDGNSSIRSEVIEYVDVCAMCQKLITFDNQKKSGEQINTVYYFSNEKTVRSTRINGDYHLSYVDPQGIKDEIIGNIDLVPVNNASPFNKLSIQKRVIDKVRKAYLKADRDFATSELKKYFADDAVVNVILNGFKKKENGYSLTAMDLISEEDNIKNLLFINSDVANIAMRPGVEDLRTVIEYECVDEAYIYANIDSVLNLVISKQTGDEIYG